MPSQQKHAEFVQFYEQSCKPHFTKEQAHEIEQGLSSVACQAALCQFNELQIMQAAGWLPWVKNNYQLSCLLSYAVIMPSLFIMLPALQVWFAFWHWFQDFNGPLQVWAPEWLRETIVLAPAAA